MARIALHFFLSFMTYLLNCSGPQSRGFQAAGIVREYPDCGNSPHALLIREVFHETGCHISVVKFTEKSARALLCASTLKLYMLGSRIMYQLFNAVENQQGKATQLLHKLLNIQHHKLSFN